MTLIFENAGQDAPPKQVERFRHLFFYCSEMTNAVSKAETEFSPICRMGPRSRSSRSIVQPVLTGLPPDN
jgi:hypothetical protein